MIISCGIGLVKNFFINSNGGHGKFAVKPPLSILLRISAYLQYSKNLAKSQLIFLKPITAVKSLRPAQKQSSRCGLGGFFSQSGL